MRSVVACLAFVLLVTSAARAEFLTLEDSSGLDVQFGLFPEVTLSVGTDTLVDVAPSGSFTLDPGLIAGTVSTTQTLTTLTINPLFLSLSNGSISVGSGAGHGVVGGVALLGVLGGVLNLSIPFAAGAGTVVPMACVPNCGALGTMSFSFPSGWTTGSVSYTGVTSLGLGIGPLVVSGSDVRTAGHAGSMTLVTPIRALSHAALAISADGFARLRFVFSAPEPSAIAAVALAPLLALLGWSRRRAS